VETYAFEVFAGYPFCMIGKGRFLLDTGIPDSVGSGELVICGMRHVLGDAPIPGFRPDNISEIMGVRVDGVIGGDILCTHGVRFDLAAGQASFAPVIPGRKFLVSDTVKIVGVTPLPVIQVHVNDIDLALGFDSGASVTCLIDDSDLLTGEPDDRQQVFFGTLNRFYDLEFRNREAVIGNIHVKLQHARLPEAMAADLRRRHVPVDGIFGAELFKQAAVTLSPCWTELYLEKY